MYKKGHGLYYDRVDNRIYYVINYCFKYRGIVPSTSNCSSLSRTECRGGCGASRRPKCNHRASGRSSSSLLQQNSSSYSKHSTESRSIWPSTIDRFCGWPTGPGPKTPLSGCNDGKRQTTAHHHTRQTTTCTRTRSTYTIII